MGRVGAGNMTERGGRVNKPAPRQHNAQLRAPPELDQLRIGVFISMSGYTEDLA